MEKKKNVIDVTIIVPVYNVENYLEKCLESLVNQDYDKNKYEIYIINDGSTDNSLNIILDYEKKYSNIKVCTLKKNKGVSNARNVGIKNANGKYLMFCDSDDYYRKDALKKFMSCVKENNSDFIMANYYITNGVNDIPVDITKYFSTKNISKEEIVSYMTLTSSAKLIKKDLFVDNNIYYPTDLKRCEELGVIPVVAYLANKPMVIKDALYYYYQRSNSASNTNSKKASIRDLDYFDQSFNDFLKNIDQNKYREEVEFRAIDHLLYGKVLVMLKSHVPSREILKHINCLNQRFPNALNNKYFKKYKLVKRIFVILVVKKCLIGVRLLSKIHQLITG